MKLNDYNITRLKQLIILYTKDNSILVRDEKAHINFLSESDFTSEEHQIAISAVKESVLQEISMELIQNFLRNSDIMFSANEKKHNITPEGMVNIKNYFRQAYNIFPLEQKKELLPLFFNYNLTQQNSIFFQDLLTNDYYFNIFLMFLNEDKLDFEMIKKQYLDDENNKYTKLYPMYEKIMSLSSMLS
ncbi:MAG: hypothetical protein CFH01_00118 [Alphaproteobacteria bacterium MarineAlpha2_Bin1]|nr:MAG: hypothetical protein CFH01_00118 [Alphaproteobacteria bacterium MarineAlpha2_Bin1]